MILFTILLGILLTLVIVLGIAAIASGATFLLVFGDLIIAVIIIGLIIKIFRRKK